MTPNVPSNLTRAGDEHCLETLVDLFTGGRRPSDTDLDATSEHLARCAACRTGLALLLDAQAHRDDLDPAGRAEFAGLLDLLAPVVHATALADHETLAAYAETLDGSGEAAARERFPAFAYHLERCADCRAGVAAVRELVADLTPVAAAAAVSTTPEAAPQQSPLWLFVGQGVWRLRERLSVLVGQASVSVGGALTGMQAVQMSPAGSARDSSLGREQRLIFTLRTVVASRAAWLRLTLDLSARLDRQLRATLGARAMTSAAHAAPDAAAAGEPWPGLVWRAELLDGPARRLVGEGATDALGRATCPMPTAGAYELTVSAGDQSWQIPLDVRR